MENTSAFGHSDKMDQYYDAIHRKTWQRRSSAMLGVALLTSLLGGAMGTAASFLPYIFGKIGIAGALAVSPPTFLAIAASAAVFAGAAGLLGMAAGAMVGSDAGAVAAGLVEKERREAIEKGNGQEVSVEQHTAVTPEKMPKLFSWKVAVFSVPLLASLGALLALSPAMAGAVSSLGFTGAKAATATAEFVPATHAAIAASASIFAMVGMVFSLKMSYLTNKFSNLIMGMFLEKAFNKEPAKEIAVEPQMAASKVAVPEVSESQHDTKFTADKLRFSLNDILEKTDDRGAVPFR